MGTTAENYTPAEAALDSIAALLGTARNRDTRAADLLDTVGQTIAATGRPDPNGADPTTYRDRLHASASARPILAAVVEFVDIFSAEGTMASLAAQFTCSEIEALCRLLTALGHPDLTARWLERHDRRVHFPRTARR
ncbi:hypothetical protein OPAG_08367 [Rhodococcus opacus PD630]|uniref:hypothetical protein n=1 Tax=Rhodococcus opacus TaxID=37919 RepID=UPI00029CC36C|nr:hypothetical protein [Rhodococcus opacus]AHK35514.1 hypothetical protein Pd630_LPD10064 [Rhodococcus opacus PD630]EHI39089.1 hypothetical protein OPAG_08367 [Rhodococcus opacus PD630]UDH01751.1 hypothetical protein K2Z90_008210 [Rhodococcus opacus PD630]